MPKTLSIVIPVFCNELSIRSLFDRLDRVAIKLSGEIGLHVIAVDDGSTDGSLALLVDLQRSRDDLTVVKLSRNFGPVNAFRAGLRFVEGDAFVVMAADLQDPPELLVEMARQWLGGSKFVIAVRQLRGDPWHSRALAWIYYKLVRTFVVKGYPERGFDMALMDRVMLAPLRDSAKNTFTPLLAYWLGFEPTVVLYDRPKREHGQSGWSFWRKFKVFLDVLLGFSATPIRLMSAIGVLVAFGSVLFGVRIVIGALRGQVPVSGFATVASLITFLLGLILVILGVIGEYLWRIFDEVNRRPEAMIDEVYS